MLHYSPNGGMLSPFGLGLSLSRVAPATRILAGEWSEWRWSGLQGAGEQESGVEVMGVRMRVMILMVTVDTWGWRDSASG